MDIDINHYTTRLITEFVDTHKQYDIKFFTCNGFCNGTTDSFPTMDFLTRSFKKGNHIVDNYITMWEHSWKESVTEYYIIIYVNKTQIDWVNQVFKNVLKENKVFEHFKF